LEINFLTQVHGYGEHIVAALMHQPVQSQPRFEVSVESENRARHERPFASETIADSLRLSEKQSRRQFFISRREPAREPGASCQRPELGGGVLSSSSDSFLKSERMAMDFKLGSFLSPATRAGERK